MNCKYRPQRPGLLRARQLSGFLPSVHMPSSIFLCLVLSGVVGCGLNSSPPQPATGSRSDSVDAPQSKSDEASPAASDVASPVDVQIMDYDGIVKVIESKRGKVVVMDCWSTWCQPCMKEFHNLVELHHQYGPDKLACISLSFNFEGAKRETPEEHRDEVLDFLRKQGATFDNVIASVPAEDLYKLLEFKTASVPAVFVYDQQGQLARQLSGEVSYDDVRKQVAELLETEPATSE